LQTVARLAPLWLPELRVFGKRSAKMRAANVRRHIVACKSKARANLRANLREEEGKGESQKGEETSARKVQRTRAKGEQARGTANVSERQRERQRK